MQCERVIALNEQNGVTIGLREIYDKLQEVGLGVQRLNDRIEVLEEKVKQTDETDDRSREALRIAKDVQEDIKWLWRTIIGGLLLGAIGALFYFAKN